MKRVVSIQDISCLGRCSLTVALPVISAMGVECAIVPTAVLSTHTAFPGFTCKDLTDQLTPIARHWRSQGVTFDAISTGYIASAPQARQVLDFVASIRSPETLLVVDPAMADNGALYKGFTPEFARAMGAVVCSKADIIDPNITEAAFMLGAEYKEDGSYDEDYVRELLQGLVALGPKKAVLTGVSLEPGSCGVYGLDGKTGQYFSYFNELVDARFHGTGDVFSSTTVGALLNGLELDEALAVAADYTVACIKATISQPDHNWYGVDFETEIPYLLKLIGK